MNELDLIQAAKPDQWRFVYQDQSFDDWAQLGEQLQGSSPDR